MTLNKAIEDHTEALQGLSEALDPFIVPDSWVDGVGVRHAVIFDMGETSYKRLEKINGEYKLIDDLPF